MVELSKLAICTTSFFPYLKRTEIGGKRKGRREGKRQRKRAKKGEEKMNLWKMKEFLRN